MEEALKLAQAAEKENFESLWVQERILWPINPQSKYPLILWILLQDYQVTLTQAKELEEKQSNC